MNHPAAAGGATLGERAADRVAGFMGSWRFIWLQTALVTVWIGANVLLVAYRWDPYPFILLNLAFSTQAAYAAPVLQLAANREGQKDRRRDEFDYAHNLLALAHLRVWHREVHGEACACVSREIEALDELVQEHGHALGDRP